MTTARIGQLRARATRELETLHRERGELILDRRPQADIDSIDARIRQAEITLQGVEDADQAAARRETQRIRDAELDAKQTALDALAAAEERRLAGIARAEQGAREMAAGFTDVNNAVEDQRKLRDYLRNYVKWSGFDMASMMDLQHIQGRLAVRLSAVMKTVFGESWYFGGIRFVPTQLAPAEDWAKGERDEGSREHESLMRAAKRGEVEGAPWRQPTEPQRRSANMSAVSILQS